MPSAQWNDIVFIQGPGIDDYLSGVEKILILDEFYVEMYADYNFLGPQVYNESISVEYPDIVGVLNTLITLEPGETLVVCGDDPRPCITLVAALLMIKGRSDAASAVREAWSILKPAYTSPDYNPKPHYLAYPGTHLDMLAAFSRLHRLLGNRLPILASLALNYDYGLGRRAYGELVTWSHAIRGADSLLLAASFSFLALSLHGKPREVLKYRLEALGEDNLRQVFGEAIEACLRVLRNYATDNLEDINSTLFRLLVSLKPGSGALRHVAREDETLTIYCKSAEDSSTPSKECLSIVNDALSALDGRLPSWAAKPRIRVDSPEGVILEPPR